MAAHIAVIGDSYTSGSDVGGNGAQSWPTLAWKLLAQRGLDVEADVAAEGGAGYGHPGDRGRVFEDLTAQAVQRSDALVVFFGSRNDQPVDPQKFPALAADTFQLARFAAGQRPSMPPATSLVWNAGAARTGRTRRPRTMLESTRWLRCRR